MNTTKPTEVRAKYPLLAIHSDLQRIEKQIAELRKMLPATTGNYVHSFIAEIRESLTIQMRQLSRVDNELASKGVWDELETSQTP